MLDIGKTLREASIPQQSDEEQLTERSNDVQGLVGGIIGRHAEFFADPDNRLEFIRTQSAKNFFRMTQYVNAKVRGEKPLELRQNPAERLGGSLPLLHTPKSSDKLPAFSRGFDAIQEYLHTTTDSTAVQIEGVAMATEALVIWVHPFTDGNGRTSRFMAKLIEGGATDMDSLIKETASSKARPMIYSQKLASKEGELAAANDEDLMFTDYERDELRRKATDLPNDTEVIYLSMKRLLENPSIRQGIVEKAEAYRDIARKNTLA